MEYDFYSVGFGEGIWINGSHWYADPFYLYSDYTINRQYESTLFDTYVVQSASMVSGGGQDMYFLYNAINSSSEPLPTPVPVPEPSSFVLFLIGLLGIFLFNKVLTRRRR